MGRVSELLHKALVPLAGRAVLSHLIELAPRSAKIVVCVGCRADQIREYVALAHPQLNVTFVDVADWDQPHGGPGASLLAAKDVIDGDLIFTSCDTLWQQDQTLWQTDHSWAGVAPIPAGTPHARWCRVGLSWDGTIEGVYEKNSDGGDLAYIGLAQIKAVDQDLFWSGIEGAQLVDNETQVSGGLVNVLSARTLGAQHVRWTDVGDESSYRLAVARLSGYDWTKIDETTYVLPETGRVVKHWTDPNKAQHRAARGTMLGEAIAGPVWRTGSMIAYTYKPGISGYEAVDREGIDFTKRLLEWRHKYLMSAPTSWMDQPTDLGVKFYHDKTLDRIDMLRYDETLWRSALDAVSRIDWDHLAQHVEPAMIHGDLNYGNIVVTPEGHIVGIDWRESFAGYAFGDARYDLGKLLAGCYVHFDRARNGDFRPWPEGDQHAALIRRDASYSPDVEIIGALALLNSAPLHAAPLDEVCVSRGCAWLEEVL